MNIDLTVCITSFNRSSQFKEALNSVVGAIKKTNLLVEIIVVDDYSDKFHSEKVRKACNEIKEDICCQMVFLRSNVGLAGARNEAIKRARGYFFTFCDDDDQWLERHILRFEDELAKSEKHDCYFYFKERFRAYFSKLTRDQIFEIKHLFSLGVTPPVAGQIFCVKLLKQVGGYDRRIKSGIDHDLWVTLLMLRKCTIKLIFSNTIVIGHNPNNNKITLSQNQRQAKISDSLQIWKHRLIKVFGEDFYFHFVENYENHIKAVIAINYLRNYKIFKFIIYTYEQKVIKYTIFFIIRWYLGYPNQFMKWQR